MQRQNQPYNEQQSTMPQPPSIVTVKDALYVTDMLSWNLLAAKKAHFFANHCQDPEIQNAIHKVGQMHQKHYKKILTYLNKQNPQN
ncbi:hypothetical protein [Fervidibacillus halotolerans]|uniref:Spore coat protein n=1 Tax=Fervidibacillus halotolerans TaxID=2980027 RepID=A0A9E8LZM2_9BACI|nr:hypothetical protein [Fervidibacillus halotolerans]WAA11921.1 hypothetical protein OE105_10040 [Fervidibacillus halotolerans]